jgi:hypothetical protein
MTYRYLVYDLSKNFSQAFDDADFTLNQIMYWVMVVSNRLRTQHYLSTKSDLFVSTFSSVTVHTDAKGRKYIDLPSQVMDLPNNLGIVYITYNVDTCKCEGPNFAQVWFSPTNIGSVQHLYLDEYTKPSVKVPYFYRVGQSVDGVSVNRIYLLGVECIKIEDVEIAIRSTLDPKTICNLDEEVNLPDELIQELMMQVLQLGRFVMLMPTENINDGEDGGELDNQMYANRAINLPDASSAQQMEE